MAAADEPFGARLRRERERRQIALSSISANTKISVALFEGLERGDVSRWPSGLFRRAFVRAYAEAIGLDPDSVAREFLERYPDPAELPFVVPAPSAPAPASPSPASAPARANHAVLRLTLADAGTKFVAGCLLTTVRRRGAAAAFDAGVALAIAILVFAASGHFWVPLGVAMFAYHLGGILLLGNTPGVCLCAPAPEGPRGRNGGGLRRLVAEFRQALKSARSVRHARPAPSDYVTTRG